MKTLLFFASQYISSSARPHKCLPIQNFAQPKDGWTPLWWTLVSC